jgi:hypothetical protein
VRKDRKSPSVKGFRITPVPPFTNLTSLLERKVSYHPLVPCWLVDDVDIAFLFLHEFNSFVVKLLQNSYEIIFMK